MPASTAQVTCRPVAFWYGASARVSWIESLRAVPVGVPGVAVEQHAELVHALDDLVLVEDLPALLQLPGRCRPSRAGSAPRRRRDDRHSGRSAGTGRVAFADGEIVGDRDRLVVGDEKAVLRPCAVGVQVRTLGAGSRPRQIYRCTAADVVAVAVRRERPRACPSRARPAGSSRRRTRRPTRC